MNVLNKIKSLWHHVEHLHSGINTKMSRDEVNLLVDIYREIMPGSRLNTGCGDCVKYALAVSASYYEREIAHVELGITENISPEVNTVNSDEVTTKAEEEVVEENKEVKKTPIKRTSRTSKNGKK